MRKVLILSLIAILAFGSEAQRKSKKKAAGFKPAGQILNDPISEFTSFMEKLNGYFPIFWAEEQGKVFVEVKNVGEEFLYVNALTAGVGSNDIGLDRGQLGNERVVKFEKYGPKLLLVQPNQDYRAVSDNEDEVKSVEEAFAKSVLAGFPIIVEDDDRYLIDLSSFLLRDAHGVASRLQSQKQGNYSIDESRSALYRKGTMNFPENSEFESLVTFKGSAKGGWIRSVTPSPDAITVRMHHSFIKLPDDDYEMREFDPRSGYIHISYQDYATPIDDPLVKKFIVRHRLEKKDPTAAVSEAVRPIIYYVDRGAPEPVRSALIEGASWWNQAFEAAGFKDAFQVKLLPEGAHPLDIRYNVIQWVHRSTRGWSYGASVVDPRTGEILKGHVSLGSLRVRQDFLIAEGLLSPYAGKEVPETMKEMALARLRQLSAHEVGHTIGLVHNFSASTNNRASVMDYPHPYVKMDANGKIDLSEAYDTDIGEWDKVAIQYGYSDFNGKDEKTELNKILLKAYDDGLRYITDQDARPSGGAHPQAHLWDNGESAADELNRMMKIRRKILDEFSEKSIREGRPLSTIEEVLVPMYLFHRYQVDATSKVIGGLNYSYATKGDGQIKTEMISKDEQLKALNALIATLRPKALMLPEELLNTIPPRAHGFPRSRETFRSKAGPVFDYYAAIETAASVPLSFLLHPERANRLVMFKARDYKQLGFDGMLSVLVREIWEKAENTESEKSVNHIIEMQLLKGLMKLANDNSALDDVRAIALNRIKAIRGIASRSRLDRKYYDYVIQTIDQFLKDPSDYKPSPSITAPDGSPIGQDLEFCSFQSH